MNFISHFYADRTHTDSHFVIGSVSPDLLSIYNSQLRIKNSHLSKFEKTGDNTVSEGFWNGLERHFFVDKVFHSSPNFVIETKKISTLLTERFPHTETPRKFFIAHILLELLLDKILIDQKPGILEAFYAHFSSQGDFSEIQRMTQLVSGNQLNSYDAFLRKFLDKKYLYHYQEYDHITYVMRRILRRVRIAEIGFLEQDAFLTLMQDYEKHLAGIHEIFFEEIRVKTQE
ncbi:MAG TPA: hypothetical protein ENJ82_00910 [Bacteroidetes bacterium]|nr:hypothetical protein [Bacteroidota bacterium]